MMQGNEIRETIELRRKEKHGVKIERMVMKLRDKIESRENNVYYLDLQACRKNGQRHAEIKETKLKAWK